MLLKERLDTLPPDQGAKLINSVIDDGEDTQFGEWVRLLIDEMETDTVGAIKGIGIAPGIDAGQAALIATGRLQALELLKTRLFARVAYEEEVDDE